MISLDDVVDKESAIKDAIGAALSNIRSVNSGENSEDDRSKSQLAPINEVRIFDPANPFLARQNLSVVEPDQLAIKKRVTGVSEIGQYEMEAADRPPVRKYTNIQRRSVMED